MGYLKQEFELHNLLYSRNTNTIGNRIRVRVRVNNLRTSMNYRTHFFMKICISHTLFLKGLMFLWCVKHRPTDINTIEENNSNQMLTQQWSVSN